jgi:23S rRNA (adenine2030-N6)-methyltransferase
MNYRHIYHAGNCADVVKHSVLTLLLESLHKKDTGFSYIDTHAGVGRYDLHSIEANKTEEYKEGINRVKAFPKSKILERYLSIIEDLNKNNSNLYPGSPWIAHAMQRPQDQLILNELHPEDCESLKILFWREKGVSVHHRDAYEFLPALVPPASRRGLVLIDPPFEKKDELDQISHVLDKAFLKWPQGIYMLWLPLKENSLADFYAHIKKYECERKFFIEFSWETPADKTNALQGSAIIILNLPWKLEESITELMQELTQAWKSSHARFVCGYK